jgi:hypothetical protein
MTAAERLRMRKPPKCKVCRQTYTPNRPLQKVCSLSCAIELANETKDRLERSRIRQDRRKAKERLKTRADWLREAQAVFNKFIRLRDKYAPCISCGKHHNGQYHAGHYRTVGSCPELRFEELNNHKQCAPCNNHLSGNLINYRRNLIIKIGQANVDFLEEPHEPKKYTIEQIKEIKAKYSKLIKDLG